MGAPRAPIPRDIVAEFCRRWQIDKFYLFGSVLREDFGSDSDIDVMVSFTPGAVWSLLDHVQMQEELATLLGRKVDLVSRRGIERSRNRIRRQAILDSAELFYAAA